MSIQAADAGGDFAGSLEVIAREAKAAIGAILMRVEDAAVRKHIDGILREAKKLDAASVVFSVPPSPYSSPNVPAGYQTVLGYMDEVNRPFLSGMKNPRNAFAADEVWLQEQANARGIPLPRVTAPACLQVHGVSESWAYPEDLLRERLF
ncbi:hypothetical protein [Brucella sp. 2716]|uniref:hypothetical protein n=1 Tax=Brucella sp. 2716 TaxID=2975052 RepID=UPI00217D6A7B|nr:hypothetical protein [Brucella sp. 2716]UWF59827.1 hypothetical protein NYO66_04765 [Brucella sp. 2716]